MTEKEGRGFAIKDRRAVESETPAEDASPKGEEHKTTEGAEEKGSMDEQQEALLPEINFVNFIISLSTTAMFHFGMFPDPDTKQAAQNLPAAEQVIDIIGVLQEKTKGNLTDEEAAILEESLYNLRMTYIKLTTGEK